MQVIIEPCKSSFDFQCEITEAVFLFHFRGYQSTSPVINVITNITTLYPIINFPALPGIHNVL